MRAVMSPRFIRPRLLLLPFVLGALASPAFLTRSAMPLPKREVHAEAMCKGSERAVERPQHVAPSCVHCRAPLLDAPLAQATPRSAARHARRPPA
jgi:hypothetical protein